ncbi:hypothetical protein CJ030_MR7G000075 [Morella rubra]|uniref:Uncharacterized protein n=1 Tax=Morella rubra TaxID=262757 RepID=A0A6A1V1C0_9ROSI|nr:hypothetical protein CJ030_MR7G000075 [Morella rubra]
MAGERYPNCLRAGQKNKRSVSAFREKNSFLFKGDGHFFYLLFQNEDHDNDRSRI